MTIAFGIRAALAQLIVLLHCSGEQEANTVNVILDLYKTARLAGHDVSDYEDAVRRLIESNWPGHSKQLQAEYLGTVV